MPTEIYMKSDVELSRKILARIKGQNIRPIPKWIFNVRTVLLFLIFALSTMFGSLSVSILWINLKLLLDYPNIKTANGLAVILIPLLWLVLSLIFLIVAYLHFRKSPRGYRVSSLHLIVGLVGTSITLGTALFFSGQSQVLHRFIRHQLPIYGRLHHKMKDMRCKPIDGMLCGKFDAALETVFVSSHAILTDQNGKAWNVNLKNAEIRGLPRIEIERHVRIWGHQTDDQSFDAADIRPYPLED